jgi:hypothetical protein
MRPRYAYSGGLLHREQVDLPNKAVRTQNQKTVLRGMKRGVIYETTR